MRRICGLPVALLLLLACSVAGAGEKLKALIIDGQNNHNWQATTPLLKQALEESGRFTVEVATTAPKGKDLSDFKPDFAKYAVVVSNYNGDLWPEETRKRFVDYIKGGGGLVVVHAANNAFTGWREYNDMIGLGWRGPEFGERVTLSEAGKVERTPKGQGPGAGHGPQHEFPIIVRDAEHPITADLPKAWLHYKDELYHGQRGPAPQDMHILATAFSASDKGGTGSHEPMLWVIPYGKGRVFTTVLGHSPEAMTCVGFIITLERGTEWAATGKVTLNKVPDDFPTADKIVRRNLGK
ncbi:MAG: ThuA domain-containing protein [Planctomycetia bacterium]|nr:ThuA domain-containing protein [Planctomycetia bacterium]